MSDSSLSFAVVSNGVCCLYDGNSFQVHVGETMLSWEFSADRLIPFCCAKDWPADERADCRIALTDRLLLLHCCPQSVLAFSQGSGWPGPSFYRVGGRHQPLPCKRPHFQWQYLSPLWENAPRSCFLVSCHERSCILSNTPPSQFLSFFRRADQLHAGDAPSAVRLVTQYFTVDPVSACLSVIP